MKYFQIVCLVVSSFIMSNALAQQKAPYNLNFDNSKYVVQSVTYNGENISIRAYENIIYVKNPVDTAYQKLNVYVPEAYFQDKSINGYTKDTAPVFFPNRVGGYMPAVPATAVVNSRGGFGGGMGPGNRVSSVVVALSKGYIVASAGARGRTTKDGNGTFTGKSPAAVVDLKAAIRYLKYNDKAMPGDANKIISNGTSAGGAMSTLIGATGNNKDYEPYLIALGAAQATDDVFAVSAYCPITNLDHADMAYEWQFNGVYTYKRGGPPFGGNAAPPEPKTISDEQIKVSKELKALFPEYVNQLKLKDNKGALLKLDANGDGSFKELVKSYVVASAQQALSSGTDLSPLSWITITNGKVTQLDFDAYIKYMERMKTPPAFDALDLSSPENQEFGTESIDKQHFTTYAHQHSTTKAPIAKENLIKMLNPMDYIGQPNTTTAKYWRIRHGSKDKDTSLAISVMLNTYLQNKGYEADLALPWDKPHSGDYDLEELFQWTDKLCKK